MSKREDKTTFIGWVLGGKADDSIGANDLDFTLLGDGKFNKHTCAELAKFFNQADQVDAMQLHIKRFDGKTMVFAANHVETY